MNRNALGIALGTVALVPFVSTVAIAQPAMAVDVAVTNAISARGAYASAKAAYLARAKALATAKKAVKKATTPAAKRKANAKYRAALAANTTAKNKLAATAAAWTAAKSQVSGTFPGATKSSNEYGSTTVTITIASGKITKLDVVYPTVHEDSRFINDYYVPTMIDEALAAQSADIAAVSGASLTFPDFKGSLQSALSRAGF